MGFDTILILFLRISVPSHWDTQYLAALTLDSP